MKQALCAPNAAATRASADLASNATPAPDLAAVNASFAAPSVRATPLLGHVDGAPVGGAAHGAIDEVGSHVASPPRVLQTTSRGYMALRAVLCVVDR